MARAVKIDTEMPPLEEFGESLGLSKARQRSLLTLIQRDPIVGAPSMQAPSKSRRNRVAASKPADKRIVKGSQIKKSKRAASR